jgi:hypothetical protein
VVERVLTDTDQTTCHDSSGREIDCAGSGQDGERIRRSTGVRARFVLEAGTVRDRLTGLLWSVDASPAEFPLTWHEAQDFVDGLNQSAFQGVDSWRLPARRELFSLVSHQRINPSLPGGAPFRNVFHGYYWSHTPCAGVSNQAWYVHFGGGRVFRGMQHGSYMVWPVSGRRWPDIVNGERFQADGDMVFDRLLNTRWHGFHDDSSPPVNWQTALDRVASLNRRRAGGRSDWRLANIRELESLVDTRRAFPAVGPQRLFPHLHDGYWSSTTSVYEPRYAWVLYSGDGAVGVGFKPKADFGALAVSGPAA